MASVNTEKIPACTHLGCGAQENDRRCYTPTGYRRPMHAVRVQAITAAVRAMAEGDTETAVTQPESKPGRKTGTRPSEKQASILDAAHANGGLYELSGYTFYGDAQRRAAVMAMADPTRGWLRYVEETRHGSVYELTDTGRDARARYHAWMNGER